VREGKRSCQRASLSCSHSLFVHSEKAHVREYVDIFKCSVGETVGVQHLKLSKINAHTRSIYIKREREAAKERQRERGEKLSQSEGGRGRKGEGV